MASITIVPTSHVAEESIRQVEAAIRKVKPDCVAVELDMNRFITMRSGEAPAMEVIRQVGVRAFLMVFVMKRLQSWLGSRVGIVPGSDMMSAVRAAEREGIIIAFVDRDIRVTLEGLRGIPWREKVKLAWFLVKGLTLDAAMGLSRSGKAGPGKTGPGKGFDLRKAPPREVVDSVLEILRKEFPGLYKTLVSERDRYMAARLGALASRYERVVAVVGAAHAPGIRRLLTRA